MERIDELLGKYFLGKTTLSEETELKEYFKLENVRPEYEKYKQMFETFSFELKQTIPEKKQKNIHLPSKTKRIWFYSISFSGIAATLLLTFWLFGSQTSEDYAIIKGKRIDNQEYAQRYTINKFNKVHDLLEKSLKPMEDFKIVRKSLKPVQKISETRERIQEIKNKLQY